MIHAVVSLVVGLLYGVMLPMLPRYPIVLAGIVAPLLWSGLLWSFLNVIDPPLNARIEWGWFVALPDRLWYYRRNCGRPVRENSYSAASVICIAQRRRGAVSGFGG